MWEPWVLQITVSSAPPPNSWIKMLPVTVEILIDIVYQMPHIWTINHKCTPIWVPGHKGVDIHCSSHTAVDNIHARLKRLCAVFSLLIRLWILELPVTPHSIGLPVFRRKVDTSSHRNLASGLVHCNWRVHNIVYFTILVHQVRVVLENTTPVATLRCQDTCHVSQPDNDEYVGIHDKVFSKQ